MIFLCRFVNKTFYFVFVTFLFNFSTNIYANQNNDIDYDLDYYDYMNLYNKCPVYDPYENFNRKIFGINHAFDMLLFRPVAKFYKASTNYYVRARVGSFVQNISTPIYFTNNVLQGNSEGSFKSFWRFVINSTLGIGGIFDIADKFGIKNEPKSFSSTLAHYGVGPGPYIVLPIFGGTNARGIFDVASRVVNPLQHTADAKTNNVASILSLIHMRYELLSFTEHAMNNSLDYYISVRDAIHSNTETKMLYPANFRCRKK